VPCQSCQTLSYNQFRGLHFASNFGHSHKIETSPLAHGLNYRLACDTHQIFNTCCIFHGNRDIQSLLLIRYTSNNLERVGWNFGGFRIPKFRPMIMKFGSEETPLIHSYLPNFVKIGSGAYGAKKTQNMPVSKLYADFYRPILPVMSCSFNCWGTNLERRGLSQHVNIVFVQQATQIRTVRTPTNAFTNRCLRRTPSCIISTKLASYASL